MSIHVRAVQQRVLRAGMVGIVVLSQLCYNAVSRNTCPSAKDPCCRCWGRRETYCRRSRENLRSSSAGLPRPMWRQHLYVKR